MIIKILKVSFTLIVIQWYWKDGGVTSGIKKGWFITTRSK